MRDRAATLKSTGSSPKTRTVPPLGAGLGGLDWNEVLPHIKSALSTLFDLRVIILEPKDEPGSL